ncbi:class I SAM-dependent methyltransferase [Paenibacillus sp. GSMTC-2017]|uniref:class I SAM-dependent methyltransferase n=1 Tax=Paenibacillus sp. GSMTC-2017 TaxID=2794350 RepID=UPI0018D5F1BF|nr:class I SAM-dependent methyltransferase [Paenibacillus sp. GSMTC-2017]MBH5320808.1 class I SAM-dependent methyltransferase [Paenibacillus sp. GSMTC-2017]
MSNHYYSKTPEVKHNRQVHSAELRGYSMKFVTDAGVFSKTGIDYGSRVLIDAMELKEDDRILDVGCGYGPIGLTAAMIAKGGHVTMIDINERAVELSKENAKQNGITNITALQSDLYEAVNNKTFNVILTNPPIRAGKATVHRVFEEGYALLESGGTMWVVIQKKQGAPSAMEKLTQLFGEVEEVTKDKGYRILKAIKF